MIDSEKKAYIFGMIFMLSNKLQILGDKMDPFLSVKQWLFLAGVLKCESNAPTLTEVSAMIESSRQNVKKIALILEKQGFVTMEKDESDARVLRVRITAKCFAHLKSRDEMEQCFLKELFCGFAIGELSLLSEAVRKLEKNITEMGNKYENKEE